MIAQAPRQATGQAPHQVAASGALWVVATPIGHLDDLAPRARDVLAAADCIAAEDTRVSRRLLARFGIAGRLVSYRDHNEARLAPLLLARLQRGEHVALISDAGTPLISDPGYRLVRAAQDAGIPVHPVPGPSAVLAALSVSGLPTDRFYFAGFAASRAGERASQFREWAALGCTVVLFVAIHDLAVGLDEMAEIFGPEREACLARELTKRHETVRRAPLRELAAWVKDDAEQQRGEAVLVVAGHRPPAERGVPAAAAALMSRLAAHLPPVTAARLTAETTGAPRRAIYQDWLKAADIESQEKR